MILNIFSNLKGKDNKKADFENNSAVLIDCLEPNKSEYDILIIDYDEPTLKILNLFFKSKGYSCCCVRSGANGLKKLDEFIPKLILLDIMLPDISAFELCKIIKLNSCFKEIPLVYLVSIPKFIVLDKLINTRANGFISKPFKFKRLNFLFKYLEKK